MDVRSATRRLSALALALWLGGFGCLLGCAPVASGATMTHAAHAQAADESHGAMNHSCCHRTKKSAGAAASVELGSQADVGQSSCPFSSPAINASSKVGGKLTASTPVRNALPEVARTSSSFAPSIVHARPPDRGGTYLRCCVFLI